MKDSLCLAHPNVQAIAAAADFFLHLHKFVPVLRQALHGLRSGFEDGIGQDVSSKGQRPERVTSNGRCEPDYVLQQVTTEKMTSNRNSVELNLERKVRLGI